MSYYDNSYYKTPSVSELQAKARKSIERAKKKGVIYDPIVVPGTGSQRKLCTSWWGKAWCSNMEQYSDYANRLPRGQRYCRNGMVIDLQIEKGVVHAKVQGSDRTPYDITITIKPLSQKAIKAIQERCEFGISSLETLVAGEFPKELQDLFTAKEGLFPSPSEIKFHCDCPDGAYLCKHVAAVMYGIGIRLDQKPLLLFELRGLDPKSLVEKAIANKLESMLKNVDRPSGRILDAQVNTNELFGL